MQSQLALSLWLEGWKADIHWHYKFVPELLVVGTGGILVFLVCLNWLSSCAHIGKRMTGQCCQPFSSCTAVNAALIFCALYAHLLCVLSSLRTAAHWSCAIPKSHNVSGGSKGY